MSKQEVAGGTSVTAGDAGDRAVNAEWRRIQLERIDEEQAEAGADVDPEIRRPRVLGAALLAALAAGVAAAILANLAIGPRGRSDDEAAQVAGAPLGLLSRPEAAPAVILFDDESARDAETAPTGDPGTTDVEVFVPVPTTSVGPPPRSDEVAP
jgi:hypothetical protein